VGVFSVRRTARSAVLAVALGGLTVVTAPAASAADASVAVPMTSFRDVLVDSAHSHVFLTGGGSTGLVVRDLAGGAVTVVSNQPGASGLALSADGTRLYVGLDQGDAISAIDTTTLTEAARYPTGTSTCPSSIAVSGTSVWFGYGCPSGGSSAGIGVLDLSGETPAVTLAKATGFSGRPTVVMAGTHLVAGESGISSWDLRSYPADGTTLGTAVTRRIDGFLNDLAATPDGADVVVACGSPYYHPRYRVSDLAADGVYGTNNPYPNAAATTAGFVAAGLQASYDSDVNIYTDGGTLFRSYDFGSYTLLQAGGLAFGADGTVYAVTGNYYESTLRLRVLREATKYATSMTLTKPATAKINTAFSLTGSLTAAGGGAIPAGAVVHVSRSSTYGTATRPNVTTDANGGFAITDTVAKRGTYTYTVTYDGDATHTSAQRSLAFAVTGLIPTLTISTNSSWYRYRQTATVTAHLGGTHTNRTLQLKVTPYGAAPVGLKTGVVDGNGYLSASYAVTRRTTFSAVFGGDDIWEPRTVTRTVTAYAYVGSSLGGYYTTSGAYRVYHTSADPVVYASVAPSHAGQCMSFLLQQYYSSAWHNVLSNSCIALDSSSRTAAVITGSPGAGTIGRVRATFPGDAYNLRTDGAWLYLKFTA
jgi:hypothetical protein